MRDIAVERRAVLVAQLADAAGKRHGGETAAFAAEIRMIEEVAADHDVAALLGGARVGRDAVDAVADIGRVGRLRHLAVRDHVDAASDLLRNDVVDRLGGRGLEHVGGDGSAFSRPRMRSISGFGRGRLPVWVVRMRSVEVFMRRFPSVSCGVVAVRRRADSVRPTPNGKGGSRMRIVDLSRELYHRTPSYPGQPPIIHGIWKTHEEAFAESGNVQGNSVMFFSMPDHGGTHIDAPRHFGKSGTPIDKYPLENCIVQGICIDLRHIAPRAEITPADLEAAVKKAGVPIPKKGTVLLCTGHHARTFPTAAYATDNPGVNVAATEWLAAQGIVHFGIDSMRPGPGGQGQFAGAQGLPRTRHHASGELVQSRSAARRRASFSSSACR